MRSGYEKESGIKENMRRIRKMAFSRIEQETIINFNAAENTAIVYTRDPAVMRRLDALVIAFSDIYRCIDETDIDRTYEIPKQFVSYRKPRAISDKQREEARRRMERINRRALSNV